MPESGSPLDRLREKRQAAVAKQSTTIEMPLPSYGGMLVVRYKRMEWEAVTKLVRAIRGAEDHTTELLASADLLIRPCETILIRVDGELVPLNEATEGFGPEPVRFDERLAQACGVPTPDDGQLTARQVVINVIADDFALVEHSNRVLEWLTGIEDGADEDFSQASERTRISDVPLEPQR
jgi:hypothetical protein